MHRIFIDWQHFIDASCVSFCAKQSSGAAKVQHAKAITIEICRSFISF